MIIWTTGGALVEAAYSNDPKVVARVGDVVIAPGNVRAIVIAIEGTFVTVLGIGTRIETGETFVLPTRWTHNCPADLCHYMDKQTLSL
jgi:hypothetical protein